MFCQYCGAELQTEDKFCPTCGKANTEDTQPTPAQTPVQIPATPTEPIDPDAPTKGKGTAALVLGIISLSLIILPIPFIGSTVAPIASIVLAIISLVLARSFKKYPKVKGSGAARIGRLLSILGIIVSALKLVVAVTLNDIHSYRNLYYNSCSSCCERFSRRCCSRGDSADRCYRINSRHRPALPSATRLRQST